MEKKELTDEEALQVLKCCYMDGGCDDCPLNLYDMPCNTDLYPNINEIINKQKSEIERLTEKCKGNSEQYELGFKCAEEMFNSRIDYCIHIESQNRELQKQVDELMGFKNEAISMSLYGKGRKDGEEGAVKDTAKEILQYIFALEEHGLTGEYIVEWTKNRIKKRYGVEVE